MFRSWLAGELGSDARICTSVGPLALILLIGAGATLAYVLRAMRGNPVRDPEAEQRASSPLLTVHVRVLFAWVMQPVVHALVRLGVRADAITLLSLLLAVASAAALSMGRFALGGWILIATGLCDYVDGRIARKTGTASPRGAVLDSVADRYADAAVLGGLAWYYRGSGPVLALSLVALVGSMLVPYVRARGEAAGVRGSGRGWLQRPERVLLLWFGTALSPAVEVLAGAPSGWPPHLLAAGAIAVLAIGTQATAAGRIARVLGALQQPTPPRPSLGVLVAAVAGTVVEACALWALTAHDLTPLPVAVAIASVAGALLASLLHQSPTRRAQLAFAIATTATLTACGVVLLMAFPGVPVWAAWIAARCAVYVGWARPLRGDASLLVRLGTR